MNQALPWTPDNVHTAKRRLGVRAYRPGQEALIEAVMQGRDALGILPTGSGKSLCFQLPALFLPKAVVVVSPLISLMKDQQDKLEDRAIPVAKLDSTLSTRDEQETVEDIWEGDPELIYVTPERLEQDECLAMLRRTGVSLLVVDEAHCVSQWGHDFRPAYLAIRRAARTVGRPPVLALTATATPAVAVDIVRQLDIPDAVVVNAGSHRENLIYEVRRTVNEADKDARVVELLDQGPRDGPAVVYAATVRDAVALHGRMKAAGVAAGLYHGRMGAKERHRTQDDFMEDRLRFVVATKAFGLGIDKPNLRMVIHYSLPDSLESYVQETGRAGRDGRPAWAILLYRLEDRRVQSYFLGGKYPRREDCVSIYRALIHAGESGGPPDGMTVKDLAAAAALAQNKVKVVVALLESSGIVDRASRVRLIRRFADEDEMGRYLSEYEGRHQSDRERLAMMMKYGQTTECRPRFLTRYFGQELPEDCGRCDNCRTGATQRVVDVRTLQSGAATAV